MALSKTFIPYGAYWSSPFCRWQGALGNANAIQLAAATAARFFEQAPGSAEDLDRLVTGFTVPQKHGFYGSPWVAGMMGIPGITGPTIAQACATSVAVMQVAATEIESGLSSKVLGLTGDRFNSQGETFGLFIAIFGDFDIIDLAVFIKIQVVEAGL